MILPRLRWAAPLLLAFLLAAGPLAAASRGPRTREALPSRPGAGELLSLGWAFVARTWGLPVISTDIHQKEGSGIDPFGNPIPKAGMSIDPFGNPSQNAGSSIDPFGNPTAEPRPSSSGN